MLWRGGSTRNSVNSGTAQLLLALTLGSSSYCRILCGLEHAWLQVEGQNITAVRFELVSDPQYRLLRKLVVTCRLGRVQVGFRGPT